MLILDLWNVTGSFLSSSLNKTNDIDRLPAAGAFLQFWLDALFMNFCWIQLLVCFEEWDSLIFLSHVFVVQIYYQGVSWLWEDPRQAGNRRCWGAGPPGAVRCDSGQVLISSLQLWNFVFFPENESFPLCFPVVFILHYFQCPLVILWISAVSALFLTVLIVAFSSLLIILIGCLLSFLDFSVDQLLCFCQCSLSFTFSLISTVRVSFRWWLCLSFMVLIILFALSFAFGWYLLFMAHVLCGL